MYTHTYLVKSNAKLKRKHFLNKPKCLKNAKLKSAYVKDTHLTFLYVKVHDLFNALCLGIDPIMSKCNNYAASKIQPNKNKQTFSLK